MNREAIVQRLRSERLSHARGPAPLGPLRRTIREVGLGLITLGVIALLFVLYQLVGTNFTEYHHQSSLAQQFAAHAGTTTTSTSVPLTTTVPSTPPTTVAPAADTTDVLPAVPEGGAIDHLVIPAIGVNQYVVEGTTEADLSRGPGHYIGTAYPGQVGNTGIAGHRTTYGAPFFELNNMKIGDPILLTDLNNHTWEYKVSRSPEVVSPNDGAVLDPTPFAQLTLTTCNPRFSATTRLVVFARMVPYQPPTAPAPVQQADPVVVSAPKAPTPRGTLSITAGADNLGQGESGAWLPALLYGLLFLALWVSTRVAINRSRRWVRVAAYVGGIAVCLLPLWFVFENSILLLPQSI